MQTQAKNKRVRIKRRSIAVNLSKLLFFSDETVSRDVDRLYLHLPLTRCNFFFLFTLLFDCVSVNNIIQSSVSRNGIKKYIYIRKYLIDKCALSIKVLKRN